uniref:Uncharacterized protein n=1 Tax=Anguilla anguilla TaxID=7936 RepID=A0A0E9VTV6_ANGAN
MERFYLQFLLLISFMSFYIQN